MKKNTKAGQIRAALAKLSPNSEEVSIEDVAWELDWIFAKDKLPLYAALKDMRKSGEVERTREGYVKYVGKRNEKPEVREAMWSVLRMRKSVTIDDLRELTGASHEYARQFLGMLSRRGSVDHIRRHKKCSIYRLIEDTGPETPQDTVKHDRLRAIRQAKNKALKELDSAGKLVIDAAKAIASARISIGDISEEDHNADQ